ncbi:MAG: hypothetical protein OXC30_02710 [Alphaproteobacteria bacterium]|nr:hypothetical protein [Alphaproteobacteria bacterium]
MIKIFCIQRLLLLCAFVLHSASSQDELSGSFDREGHQWEESEKLWSVLSFLSANRRSPVCDKPPTPWDHEASIVDRVESSADSSPDVHPTRVSERLAQKRKASRDSLTADDESAHFSKRRKSKGQSAIKSICPACKNSETKLESVASIVDRFLEPFSNSSPAVYPTVVHPTRVSARINQKLKASENSLIEDDESSQEERCDQESKRQKKFAIRLILQEGAEAKHTIPQELLENVTQIYANRKIRKQKEIIAQEMQKKHACQNKKKSMRNEMRAILKAAKAKSSCIYIEAAWMCEHQKLESYCERDRVRLKALRDGRKRIDCEALIAKFKEELKPMLPTGQYSTFSESMGQFSADFRSQYDAVAEGDQPILMAQLNQIGSGMLYQYRKTHPAKQ